jgi:exopolyphosphatase
VYFVGLYLFTSVHLTPLVLHLFSPCGGVPRNNASEGMQFTISHTIAIILSVGIARVANTSARPSPRPLFFGRRGGTSCFAHQRGLRGSAPSYVFSQPSFSNRVQSISVLHPKSSMSLSSTTKLYTSLPNFLDSIYEDVSERLKHQHHNNGINIIMGNEAGDTDSIMSSLCLGYVNNVHSTDNCKTATEVLLDVPIVSIPRADIALRRDAMLLLDMAGIIVSHLYFLDDEIVTSKLLANTEQATKITLVDHNQIRSSLAYLTSKVTEIVDHHEDENAHQSVSTESGKRIIAFEDGQATVASTCTLVAERLFQSLDPTTKIDGALGIVLLGTILLDSVNMLPEAGKGTARDADGIQHLLKRTDWSSCANTTPTLVDAATLGKIFPNGRDNSPDTTTFFEVLSNAKFDPKFWYGMSVMDCLRIDYKKFTANGPLVRSIGLSSVLMDMDSIMDKENFHEDMANYMSKEGVDLFGILSLYFEDGNKPVRELLLTGSDEVVDSFTQYLLHHPDAACLKVEERSDKSFGGGITRVFRQGNAKGSRKQVAPILLNHASTLSKL